MTDFSKIDPSLKKIIKNLKGERVTTWKSKPEEGEQSLDGKWDIVRADDHMPRHSMFPQDFLNLPDWQG